MLKSRCRSEKSVVNAVLRELRARGAKVIKTAPPGVEAGTPDILGCWRGRALAIECKRADVEPTPLQLRRLQEWAAADAITMVVWDVGQARGLLDHLESQ